MELVKLSSVVGGIGPECLWDQAGLGKLSAGLKGIGHKLCGFGQDWSELIQEQMRLARRSVGVGGICQLCCRSCWDWSRMSAGTGRIVQTFCENKQNWSSAEVGGIGQTFCKSRMECSNFLQEQRGLIKTFAGAGGTGETFQGSG